MQWWLRWVTKMSNSIQSQWKSYHLFGPWYTFVVRTVCVTPLHTVDYWQKIILRDIILSVFLWWIVSFLGTFVTRSFCNQQNTCCLQASPFGSSYMIGWFQIIWETTPHYSDVPIRARWTNNSAFFLCPLYHHGWIRRARCVKTQSHSILYAIYSS